MRIERIYKIAFCWFIIGLAMGWLSRCEREQPTAPTQIIEKIVYQKQKAVDSVLLKVVETEKRIAPKRTRIDSLKIKLDKEVDTVFILAIQDTIIIEQTDIINSLDSVITSQKIAIKGLQEINAIRVDEINLLSDENKSLKKEKKGRLIGTIAVGSIWAVVSWLLIFNK